MRFLLLGAFLAGGTAFTAPAEGPQPGKDEGQVINYLKLGDDREKAPEPPAPQVAPAAKEAAQQPAQPAADERAAARKSDSSLLVIRKMQKKELDNTLESPCMFSLPAIPSIDEELSFRLADESRQGMKEKVARDKDKTMFEKRMDELTKDAPKEPRKRDFFFKRRPVVQEKKALDAGKGQKAEDKITSEKDAPINNLVY